MIWNCNWWYGISFLFFGSFRSKFVVFVRVPSMSQRELFNHLLRIVFISYWKLCDCVLIKQDNEFFENISCMSFFINIFLLLICCFQIWKWSCFVCFSFMQSGPLHMDEQRRDDHQEPTYNSSVPIQGVDLKTIREQCSGRGAGRLGARHDNDDDDNILSFCG